MSKRDSQKKKADLSKAENDVQESSAEFEQAMDHLEGAVDQKVRKVQGVVHRIKQPKEKAQLYYSRARDASSRAIRAARGNPMPLIVGGGALLGSFLVGTLLGYRSLKSEQGVSADFLNENVDVTDSVGDAGFLPDEIVTRRVVVRRIA